MNPVDDRYFEWLCAFVYDSSARSSCRKLLYHLYRREFVAMLSEDESRILDGLALRHKFARECHVENVDLYLTQPCSVFEMMVALAYRCEDQIMEDITYGDRTGLWFWTMIVSLGLGGMTDEHYNSGLVDRVVDIFLTRSYDANGNGGLFYFEDPPCDIRQIEIWYQMAWWLTSHTT